MRSRPRACGDAAARDWSGWDYLQLWVYTDTTRTALPRDPVGLTLHTPDKDGDQQRIDGEKRLTLRGDGIAQEFQVLVENYIENRFGQAGAN